MPKIPKDASKKKVIRTLEQLGSEIVREHEHISMIRENDDGTPLTMPNHRRIKGSTLRNICTQSGISRRQFLLAFAEA
jgi:predicted RNA binding protein YcfA (HicA-like mRNA interferase family)